MGLDCFGSLGNLLLGAGLGILAVSTLASVVLFGSAYDDLEFPGTYLKYDPLYDFEGIYATVLAITILGAIAACAAIAAIALSALMGGNKIVLIIVGGAASVLALGCIISEGIYYGKVRSYSINGQKGNNYVRNSSRAQRYIRNAIEELYTQGYENLKNKFPNQVGEMEDWDTATKKLNEQVTEGNTITVLNYPNFFGYPISEKHIYLTVSNGLIYANYNGLDVPVASLRFQCENPSSVTYKAYGCWNDTTKLKCKTLDYKYNYGNENKYNTVILDSEPFTITQNMLYDDNYRTELQQEEMNKEYIYKYDISGFPVAYHILTPDDLSSNGDVTLTNYYYEEDTNHFRFSAESYCKAEVKSKEDSFDFATKAGKMTSFFFCIKEPTSLEKIEDDDNCEDDPISRPELASITSKIPATRLDQTAVFEVAYAQTDIGIYPGFHEDYFSYTTNQQIYSYGISSNKLISYDPVIYQLNDGGKFYPFAQFAVAQLIIQIVGIVLWGAGKGIGMVFGGSD